MADVPQRIAAGSTGGRVAARLQVLLACAALAVIPARARPARIVWAWERPEALDTLPPDVGIAAVTGFLRLRGDAIVVRRGRRFPLLAAPGRPPPIAVVHIEVDQNRPLEWSPALAGQVVGAALAFARGAAQVQVDMEVRTSQRGALLDVLRGVRAGLPAGASLSMTALASWCETETWLDTAPVDEIVPMLFRMGPRGDRLRGKLAVGGDFNDPRCRAALGIATDTPAVVPQGRRVYVFNPRSWDAASIASLPPG